MDKNCILFRIRAEWCIYIGNAQFKLTYMEHKRRTQYYVLRRCDWPTGHILHYKCNNTMYFARYEVNANLTGTIDVPQNHTESRIIWIRIERTVRWKFVCEYATIRCITFIVSVFVELAASRKTQISSTSTNNIRNVGVIAICVSVPHCFLFIFLIMYKMFVFHFCAWMQRGPRSQYHSRCVYIISSLGYCYLSIHAY